MTTAIQLITDAMGVIGVIGQNETPTSSESALGLRTLNSMLALWANDRTFAYTVTTNSKALTSGQASYTVGSGGDINITRPVTIDYAYVRLNNVDFPLQKLNSQDYSSIPFKDNQSFPSFFYYDQNFPLATIYIYGVPSADMTLYLDTWTQLTQFSSLVNDLSFPPGYEMAIIYNLGKFLAPHYGVSLSTESAEVAVSSLAMVRERNMPDLTMKTEAGLITGNRGVFGYGPWSY